MFATPWERAVRRQVRARLRSSELLWREYLPRRRIERWCMVGRFFRPLVFVFGIPLMAVMFALLQLGLGLLADQGPMVGKHNGPILPLAFNAVLLIGVGFTAIADLRKALTRSKELAECAYFPMSDRDFRRPLRTRDDLGIR